MKKPALFLSLSLVSLMGMASPKPKPAHSRSTKSKESETDLKEVFSKLKLKGVASSSKIANIATRDIGTYYRKGVSLQCANYVSHVVKRAGGTPPSSSSFARSWLKWGTKVQYANIRPGDIIITSRGRSSRSGHILIYKGGGKAIHRSTRYKAIGEISLDYYKSRILGIRRNS